ncbi:unnamed protein product [Rotaria magnacalcarata]|uniref:G-protein coupled receptors family 1 profile domain-containing protein n=1 Tax=Rotaria magnacalcarata TaxID=392030 RepID=A0A816PFV4_9BILA|nr:unnamed protein product [Rotaria magnacalcarata]
MSINNLTLCRIDYFKACWCQLNASEPIQCSYLLRHAASYSNSSYFCTYHTIRRTIDCLNSSYIFSKSSASEIYIYSTILIFIIGLLGNGLSIITLLCSKLCRLDIYKNLTIFCFLNILYLLLVLIRHRNIYHQDLRNISTKFCRMHTFIIAFIGHLCSWQLVSTSIQRLYALLSLKSQRTTSWIQACRIFLIYIVIPLLVFDAQILFNYGLFKKTHICNEISNDHVKHYQDALKYPIDSLKISTNTSIKYIAVSNGVQPIKFKNHLCTLWNIFDTFLYAIIPFIITLICNVIIILKVLERRRSATTLGGISHINRCSNASSDHLSALLITINILFIIMTGPLNVCLVIQSIHKCLLINSSSMKLLVTLNEYLRILQNSYHALSFIFYCLIGKKFRNSAKFIVRTIYCKLIDCVIFDTCLKTSLISCCFDRNHSLNAESTTSSTTRPNESRQLAAEKRKTTYLSLNVMQPMIDIANNISPKNVITLDTSAL